MLFKFGPDLSFSRQINLVRSSLVSANSGNRRILRVARAEWLLCFRKFGPVDVIPSTRSSRLLIF